MMYHSSLNIYVWSYIVVSYMDSEIDQLCKICKILGVPDLNIFPEGTNTSRLLSIFSYEEVSFCLECSIFCMFDFAIIIIYR